MLRTYLLDWYMFQDVGTDAKNNMYKKYSIITLGLFHKCNTLDTDIWIEDLCAFLPFVLRWKENQIIHMLQITL